MNLSSKSAITMNNVGFKSNGKIILNSISKSFDKNQKILLLGPNGSGKSTLLNVMAGLLKSTGTVSIYGENAYSNQAKKTRAFVPQLIDFPFKLTVLELITFVRQHYNKKISTDEISRSYNIDLHEYAYNLSGGKKRRLALALALLANPQLLLLDEPESGLDVQFRESILQEIILKTKKKQMTIIMASHFFESSTKYFDRVLIIKKGDIIFDEKMDIFLKLKTNILCWDIYTDKPQEAIELVKTNQLRHVNMGHSIRLYLKQGDKFIPQLKQTNWPNLNFQPKIVTAEDVYLFHAGE